MPFAVAAIASAAAGLAGAGGAAATGAGKSDFHAGTFGQTKEYDPSKFQYGGTWDGADAAANRYRWQADNAQNRGQTWVDYTGAKSYDQAGFDARRYQQEQADLMRRRALGQEPSIAQMQAARDMQRAQAAQSSQAAGARGAAGLALAQQNAASNIANSQSAISSQAQINAAQERYQAGQAAYGAYSGIRAGDLASQQQQAQQAQYNAQLAHQQRLANDQYSLGMTGYENQVRQAQLNADMNQQQLMANSYSQANQINSGVALNNANMDMNYWKMGLGAAEGGASMYSQAQMGKRADGGPVEPGKPYLVGERGPEVIIPADRGLVVPNERVAQFTHGRQGEDYGHRTAQYSMDAALAQAEAERRQMAIDERNRAKETVHDTPAMQAAVRQAYLNGLAHQADQQMAAYRTALARGSSVVRNEGELGDEPPAWLQAYMQQQQQQQAPQQPVQVAYAPNPAFASRYF